MRTLSFRVYGHVTIDSSDSPHPTQQIYAVHDQATEQPAPQLLLTLCGPDRLKDPKQTIIQLSFDDDER